MVYTYVLDGEEIEGYPVREEDISRLREGIEILIGSLILEGYLPLNPEGT